MRYLLITALFLTLTQTKAQVGIPDSTAKLLFEKESALFVLPQDTQYLRVLSEKALLYRKCEKYAEAIHELERGVTLVKDSGLVFYGWKYEALINYYLVKDFLKAAALLERFTLAQAEAIGHKKEYLFLRWATLIENKEWQKSKEEMYAYCLANQHDSLLIEIAKLPVDFKIKDPGKAKTLSTVLPGTGSIYAGYPVKGLTSFVLVGGLATLTTLLAINQFYVTGLVSGLMPTAKFYRGNIRLSQQLAYRKNSTRALKLKEAYFKALSAILLGVK